MKKFCIPVLLLILFTVNCAHSQVPAEATFLKFIKKYNIASFTGETHIFKRNSKLYSIGNNGIDIFDLSNSVFGDSQGKIDYRVKGQISCFGINESDLFMASNFLDQFGNRGNFLYKCNLNDKTSQLYFDFTGIVKVLISGKQLSPKDAPSTIKVFESFLIVQFDNGIKIIFDKNAGKLQCIYMPNYENGTMAVIDKKNNANYKKVNWQNTPYYQDEFKNTVSSNIYSDVTFNLQRGDLVLSNSNGNLGNFSLPGANLIDRGENLFIDNNLIYVNCYKSILVYQIDNNKFKIFSNPNPQISDIFYLTTNFKMCGYSEKEVLIAVGSEIKVFNIQNGTAKPLYNLAHNISSLSFDKSSGMLGVNTLDFDVYFINTKNPEKNVNNKPFNYQNYLRLKKYGCKKFNIWKDFTGMSIYYTDGTKENLPFSTDTKLPVDNERLSNKIIPVILANQSGSEYVMPIFPHETQSINDLVNIDFFQYDDNRRLVNGKYYEFTDYLRSIIHAGFVISANNLILGSYNEKSYDLFDAVVIPEVNKVVVHYRDRTKKNYEPSQLIKIYSIDSLVSVDKQALRINDKEAQIKSDYSNYIKNYNTGNQEKYSFIKEDGYLYKISLKPSGTYSYNYSYDEDTIKFYNNFKELKLNLDNADSSFVYYNDNIITIINPNKNIQANYGMNLTFLNSNLLGLINTNSFSTVGTNSNFEYVNCKACKGTGINPKVYEPGVGLVGGGKCLVCGGTGKVKADLSTVEKAETERGNWNLDKSFVFYSKVDKAIYVKFYRMNKKYQVLNSNDVRVTGNYL